jgi:hypothetical protein
MRRKKWVKPPEPTLREMIRNTIMSTPMIKYTGKDFATTLDSLYFYMYGHNKQDVYNEISKWIDLTGVDLNTSIVLPEKFFE